VIKVTQILEILDEPSRFRERQMLDARQRLHRLLNERAFLAHNLLEIRARQQIEKVGYSVRMMLRQHGNAYVNEWQPEKEPRMPPCQTQKLHL
jgi:hypothetical protein